MLTQELWCWLDLWILCEFLFFGRPGCVGYFLTKGFGLTHAETPGVHQSWKEQISTRRLRPGKVEVIGKVIGNFWQKSMDLQFIMFFEMDENFLFGCFGFFVDVFWRFLRKKDDLVTFRRWKKTFFDVPFFSKKTLPGTKTNPEVVPGRVPKGWFIVQVDPIGSIAIAKRIFFMDFFGVGETQFGEVFWNKNETHGSLKILIYTHTVFIHTYQCLFFGIFPVLQSLKEKSTFHKTHRLSSKRAQEGRRWVLMIKTSCFAYFNDVSGWCLVSVKWWICNETCLNMPKCLVTSVKCWWFWNL